jgi:hypothetical protein
MGSSDIHAIVIMRPSGEVIVAESLDLAIDVNLLSGFFAALTSFGRSLLKDEVLDTIELGLYRVFFETASIEGEEFFIVALASRRANIAGTRPKLQKIKEDFLAAKGDLVVRGEHGNLTIFEDFKPRIREIVNEKVVLLTAAQKSQVLGIFQRLYELSEYAIGAVLLTQTGDILQSFMAPPDLESITRLLEGRFLAGAKLIKEIISVEDHGIVVLIGSGDLITAVMFQSLCPLGTAELFARRFADQINTVLKNPRKS